VLRYAAITPARNELANLQRLAACLDEQRARPARWVIVDDGSSDGTLAFARELASRHEWIRAAELADDGAPIAAGRKAGRDIVAFHRGLEEAGEADCYVKLDADVSFAPDFFAELLAAFVSDPHLGIAGGLCYELEEEAWRPVYSTEGHVRGATRMWRAVCLERLLPLPVRLGWDGVDELKAQTLGWRTRTIRTLPFRHHRKVAARDGSRWRKWADDDGRTSWYLGYRPSYVVFRALHHARRERAAIAMVWGYMLAAIAREERYDDPDVRAFVRRYQRARNLPLRLREVRG